MEYWRKDIDDEKVKVDALSDNGTCAVYSLVHCFHLFLLIYYVVTLPVKVVVSLSTTHMSLCTGLSISQRNSRLRSPSLVTTHLTFTSTILAWWLSWMRLMRNCWVSMSWSAEGWAECMAKTRLSHGIFIFSPHR